MASNGKVFYSPQIKKIILFMAKYYKENECYPKLDEIGKALNVSKQRIGILIKDAEKLGLVESHNYFMRKYSLINTTKDSKLKVNNYYEL
jgi:DNA-binding MarR family transcriptional regulator|tara:strand:+ start:31 stop:300 length:270 start_codon:yes stop_codon:yes gene_type:complete